MITHLVDSREQRFFSLLLMPLSCLPQNVSPIPACLPVLIRPDVSRLHTVSPGFKLVNLLPQRLCSVPV